MSLTYANDEVVKFTDADGTEHIFAKSQDGTYNTPVSVQSKLTYSNNIFILEEKSGIRYYFTAQGRLDKIVDTNNNTTTISYLTDGNINSITDASGRQVIFSYLSGKLYRITGNDITTVEYAYSGNNLTAFRFLDATGAILQQTIYGYDVNNFMISITDGEGNVTGLTYYTVAPLGRRVKTIENKLTISGVQQSLITNYSYQISTDGVITAITDPKDYVTEYETNNMGEVIRVTEDKNVLNLKTTFEWDEQNNLVSVIAPKGNITPGGTGYETVFEYEDSTGNLLQITDPKNNSSKMIYSDLNLPEEISDFSKVPYISKYESETRNEILSSDPLFSTIVTEYDSAGNVEYQTDPIGLGNNLVTNSGFEDWSGTLPDSWAQLGTGGTISKDTAQFVNGNNSAKLVSYGNSEDQQAILLSNIIPIEESSKYNVSWFVKTQNAGEDFGGATADIHFYDPNGIWLGSPYVRRNIAPTIGTTDTFIRKGARIDTPAGVGAKFAKIALKLTGGAGTQATAWFDNIQFEYGSVINQYNLVYNSGFEYDADLNNFPDEWLKTNLTSNDILDAQYKRSGKRSLLINGSSASKNAYQVIEMPEDIGTPIYFSGWSRAAGVSATGGNYQLVLQFNNEDGTFNQYALDFAKSDHDWQYLKMVALAPKKFNNITIMCKLENQTGKVWFDDIRVRLAGAPNAIISAYNITQNGSFEMDNNQDNIPEEWNKFAGITGDLNIIERLTMDSFTVTVDGQQQSEKIMPFSDDYMIKISDTSSWVTLATKQSEPIKADTVYTASAVIRAREASGSGAVIKFDILNSAGAYLTQKVSKALSGSADWQRVVVTLTLDEAIALNSQASRFRIAIGTLGATAGSMYFDAVRVSEGNELVSFTYDTGKNYVNEITNQDKNKIGVVNDNRGNAKTITDPIGYIYTMTYDKFDNIKTVKNPAGLTSIFFYDKNNNLKQIDNHSTAYLNTTAAIQYNELQLPKSISDSAWRATNFEYDKNANLTKIAFPNLNQILFTYDTADRVRQKSYAGDNTIWAFTYDENDNLLTVNKNAVLAEAFTYDELDRLETEAINYSGASNSASYTYNPGSQLLGASYNIGSIFMPVTYEYDKSSYNVDIAGPNNTGAAFMYDEESRIKKIYVKQQNMGYVTYREYDEGNRVVRIRTENTLGAPIFDYTYEYDPNNNRTKEINKLNDKWVQYIYDSINQLIEEQYYDSPTDPTPWKNIYSYDLLGNRSTKNINGAVTSYGYNQANELTTLDGAPNYTHDQNGNLKTSANYEFIYNAENQLIQVKRSGIVDATYEYNWQGLRSKKTAGTKVEYYYYTGDELTYVTDGSNALKYFFVRDTNGRLLHMIDYKANPVKVYEYVHDVHGSIVGLADETGRIVLNYQYDAWGVLANTPESIITGSGEQLKDANPFRYAGYQFDSETGLYYLRARYYSPGLGRFLTMDSMIGVNRYAYAENNPVKMIDSSGYAAWPDTKSGYDFEKIIYHWFKGLTRNNVSYPSAFGNRRPDIRNIKVIGEIKNVLYQALTRQIRGMIEIAKDQSRQFVLVISEKTELSKNIISTILAAKGLIIRVSSTTGKIIEVIGKRVRAPFIFIIDSKQLDEFMKRILNNEDWMA